jgi:hypothetical protein
MRRLLAHPQAGRFRSQGSIEWPDDQYTRKRLADGSIKLAEAAKQQPAASEPRPSPPRPSRRAREEVKDEQQE